MRIALVATLGFLALTACSNDETEPPDRSALASDALVWGYPLVVSERTFQTLASAIGVNQMLNQVFLARAGIRFIVAPNQDTLYSVAVLDLRSEPMILRVPDVFDRYWGFQFLDAWTNSFHYIGTRATAGKGGQFAIVAPGFVGDLPIDATLVESPTPQMLLLGRYVVRDEADVRNVVALERTLTPLHVLTGSPAPPALPPIGDPPGLAQAVGENGPAFFDELGDVLAVNPPASDNDRRELARFAALGLRAGSHPAESANAELLSALGTGVQHGLARVADAAVGKSDANGWVAHLDIGTYPNDPLLRAAVAKFAWAANIAEESVYAVARAEPGGAPFTGEKRYRLHFDAGGLPPISANGFWSVSVYGPDMFFVDNPLNRNAIGDRTSGLQFNADGSLDLYIQSEPPPGHESNWLPAPTAAFILMMRLFLPDSRVLAGQYVFPPVTALGAMAK